MPRSPQRPRQYNVELVELLKYAKPWTELELSAICERLGDHLEAKRWKEAIDQERNT